MCTDVPDAHFISDNNDMYYAISKETHNTVIYKKIDLIFKFCTLISTQSEWADYYKETYLNSSVDITFSQIAGKCNFNFYLFF